MALKIQNEFELEQEVFLVTDPDQNRHLITAIVVLPGAVMYRLSCNGEEAEFYAFEISRAKNVI
jgi:hypothetical protein